MDPVRGSSYWIFFRPIWVLFVSIWVKTIRLAEQRRHKEEQLKLMFRTTSSESD